MTQDIRTIRIATQGPAGPAGLYPHAIWASGSVPYVRSSVLAHNGGVWLALRDTSVEPSSSVPADWASWLDFSGMVSGFATLGDDGKLTASQLPAIAITDTFTVNSQSAMLALAAHQGDIAIRTDVSKTYVLSGSVPTVLGNWTEVLFSAPVVSVAGLTGTIAASGLKTALAVATGDVSGLGALATLNVGSGLASSGGNLSANVTSVAGRTGAVTLSKTDVGLGSVPNVDASDRANHTGTQTASTITGLAAVATSGAKADVGLGNVPNTDATNASNIASGTLPDARLSSNVARRDQANTFGDNAVSRFSGVSSTQTGDYTLAAGDNGTIVYVNKSTAVTITLPNSLAAGFNCVVVQEGAGQVTFAGASGATKQAPNAAFKTSAQYGSVSLFVKANAGSAADWRLDGALTA